MGDKQAPVSYSPSNHETFHLCEKKYYFTWLNRRRQGWRDNHFKARNALYQAHLLSRLQDSSRWAGNLFHQMMTYTFRSIDSYNEQTLGKVRAIAKQLAEVQFAYSQERRFWDERPTRLDKFEGLKTDLILSEHYHNIDDTGILESVQEDVDHWLCTTFSWEHWSWLVQLAQNQPIRMEAEPERWKFVVEGVSISARMDLGIETEDRFFIIDWKCQQIDDHYREHKLNTYRQQLLTYALWPVFRDMKPMGIDQVVGLIYNPIEDAAYKFDFDEEDESDFEMKMVRWKHINDWMFPAFDVVDINDLAGPESPDTVCSKCQYRTICGANISWQSL